MSKRDIRTPQGLQILYCIIYSIFACLSILLFVIACKHLCCGKSAPHKYVTASTVLAMLGYFATVIICWIATLFEVIYDPVRSDRGYEDDLSLPGAAFYMLGRWSMLLLFIQRMDYTFRGSVFGSTLVSAGLLIVCVPDSARDQALI